MILNLEALARSCGLLRYYHATNSNSNVSWSHIVHFWNENAVDNTIIRNVMDVCKCVPSKRVFIFVG